MLYEVELDTPIEITWRTRSTDPLSHSIGYYKGESAYGVQLTFIKEDLINIKTIPKHIIEGWRRVY
jgi:hypothetical protein